MNDGKNTAIGSDATSAAPGGVESNGATKQRRPPAAQVERISRRGWWAWLIPLAALAVAVWLGFAHWVDRGPVITITFSEGHGIKAGDALRCRGIDVGVVETVALIDTLDGVVLTARLAPESAHIASPGTRFWIVRPSVSLTEVRGLETVTGPRYVAVLPAPGSAPGSDRGSSPGTARSDQPGTGDAVVETEGDGDGDGVDRAKPASGFSVGPGRSVPLQSEFVGLDEPPIMAEEEPGGLEINMYASRRHGLRAGAPVTYRQFRVGTVMSVALASDAGSVQVRAYIRPAYAELVRENTRFWAASGYGWDVGWTGVSVQLESVAALLDGGVAMATPEDAAEAVRNGHRFTLHDGPEDEWLAWQPALSVGSAELPGGKTAPSMLRAATSRTGGRLWNTTTTHRGWLLPVAGGVVGPEALVAPPGKHEAKVVLEVFGQRFQLTSEPAWRANGLAKLGVSLPVVDWPVSRTRSPAQPEDCLVFADRGEAPTPLAAQRLSVDERDAAVWRVDPSISFDHAMQGAAVVARSDGAVIGLLRVEDGVGAVARWPVVESSGEVSAVKVE